MTLLLTIAAPDALVMAADSALTTRIDGDLVSLTGFTKIVYVPKLRMGISITGSARVGGTWTHLWLAKYCDEVATKESPDEFAIELAETLNGIEGANDDTLAFQIGTWIRTGEPQYSLPIVWEVSNPDGNGFKAVSLVAKDFTDGVATWQKDKSRYVFRIFAAGIPKDYTSWIVRMLPEYSKLVGPEAGIPRPNGESLTYLAKFLIRQVCDLLVIAQQPNVVAAPILTRVLLPNPTYLVSDYR